MLCNVSTIFANDFCISFANIAEYSMEKRQNNTTYTKLGVRKGLKDIVDINNMSDEEYKFVLHIINEAFTVKRYGNIEQRQEIIEQFSNNVYTVCRENVYQQLQQYQSETTKTQEGAKKLTYNNTNSLCKKLSSKQFHRCNNGLEGNNAPNCNTYKNYMFNLCINSNYDDELLKRIIKDWGK